MTERSVSGSQGGLSQRSSIATRIKRTGLDETLGTPRRDQVTRRSTLDTIPKRINGSDEEEQQLRRPGRALQRQSVWAAMIAHDQLKFQREQSQRREKQMQEQRALSDFYRSQVEQKRAERAQLHQQRRKQEQELLRRLAQESNREKSKQRTLREDWKRILRDQYQGRKKKESGYKEECGQYWPFMSAEGSLKKLGDQRIDNEWLLREKKARERREKEKNKEEELEYLNYLGIIRERRQLNQRSARLSVQQQLERKETHFQVRGGRIVRFKGITQHGLRRRRENSKHCQLRNKKRNQSYESEKKKSEEQQIELTEGKK